MKPYGPIPPDFIVRDGQLLIGGVSADQLAREGTPVFAYDFGIVRARIARLRAALPAGLGIHYAMKANPLPALVAAIVPLVDAVDTASGGEIGVARGAGATHISFAGPGKRDDERALALREGVTINLESEGEADRTLALAERLGLTPRFAVRVNPDFALKGSGMKMGGGASPFGIDAERVPALVRRLLAVGVDWQGFHIFAGSQSLDADAIVASQAATVALAAELAEAAGAEPPSVNLGGGFGVSYFAGDQALDIESIGQKLAVSIDHRTKVLGRTRFALELGRWLVAECGVYLTRVVDRKESRGETFLVVDGGLHHQLAATGNFGTVIRRNYPIAVASKFNAEPEETVNVVGPLCTPLDRLGDRVRLPRAEPGDLIAVFMAGAYGRTASPSRFLSHPEPRELLLGQ